MELFGWICLLGLAIFTTFALIAGLVVDYAFTGRKFSIGYALSMGIPAIVPAMLWYGVCIYAPFVMR